MKTTTFNPPSEILKMYKLTYYHSLLDYSQRGVSSWIMHIQLLSYGFLYQQTPLHTAVAKGHDYTVICLIKNGADISIKDKNGVSVTILLMIDIHCWFELELPKFPGSRVLHCLRICMLGSFKSICSILRSRSISPFQEIPGKLLVQS